MSGKFIRNWAVMTIVWLVLTLLWHVVLFATSYGGHLQMIARYVNGTPTPLMAWFLLAHILVGFGFAKFLPVISHGHGSQKYMMNGVLLAWLSFGFFAILSHALFAGWGGWLMAMDIGFGTIGGIINGWIMYKLV